MDRLGLALSGGGFRATLYHLGVVRFLRDAGILPKITHMTTVSGGSVLGAHLALNWDRYCGSPHEFDEAADEIVRFVQLDTRNRIVRRFPFASATNLLRRLLRLGMCRQLTRSGLLERHYERFLYGDTSLFQLPDKPRLHILSTNLSEGCLCSFYQGGLLLQRRAAGRRDRFERVNLGLATVPMAVAASSAFPGFFPPLELNGWDVGAEEGEFDRQAFTDGGVYDNLGLRMFRCIEQSWVRDATPLKKADFLQLQDATAALMSAENLPENTPLRRLREMLAGHDPDRLGLGRFDAQDDLTDAMIEGLWEIIRSEALFRDPSFQNMELTDPGAQSLMNFVTESGRTPELNDRLWLNRQIVDSALRQVIGKPCLRVGRKEFDGILVSDAGGKFKVTGDTRAGGLVRTALRSSDILMDRVWQLELEAFENSPGVVFIPISDVVEPSQDRFAPHPDIQRQTRRIRTDLDRFSELEISALVQHGYCVARKACRAQGETFSTSIPTSQPWDPLVHDSSERGPKSSLTSQLSDASRAISTARRLQNSSRRRIWSRLLSLRDWPTYVWIPLIAVLVLCLPYALYQLNEKAQQQRTVLSAIAETSPVYRKILELMKTGPVRSLDSMPYDDVQSLQEPDFTGFEVVSDTRIVDLRAWSGTSGKVSTAFSHMRLRVRRTPEGVDNRHLRYQRSSRLEKYAIVCRNESLNPSLSRLRQTDGSYRWEIDLDFSRVPVGGDVDVVLEGMATTENASQFSDQGRFDFSIFAQTGLVQIWVLMPEGRKYDAFELIGYPIDKPESVETIVPNSKVELPFGSIATFRLINPHSDYRYECHWRWIE